MLHVPANLIVIHSIPQHESARHREPNVISKVIVSQIFWVLFVKEHTNLYRGCSELQSLVHHMSHRASGVVDVLDDQDVSPQAVLL